MEKLVPLSMIEGLTNILYTVEVTKEIYDRTQTDIVLATEILTRRIHEGITVFDGPLHSYETSNSEAEDSSRDTDTFTALTSSKSKESEIHNWTQPEVLLLITTYKNHQLELLDENNSKNEVWSKFVEDMSASLAQYDLPPIDLKKCKTKMETLKRHYISLKDSNKKSGNQKISWAYYDEMEELFGEQPWVKPLSTAGSNDYSPMDPNMINTPNKRKKSMADFCAELLEAKKERSDKRDRQHQENLAAANDLTAVLKDFVAFYKQK